MGPNDVIILNSTLAQKKYAVHASLDDDAYFEVFSIEQVLKNFDLSYEEQLGGIIGGGGDGGIDGLYIFVDGDLLDDDTDLSKYKKSPSLDIYFVQSKTSPTFTEKAFDAVFSTLSNILDLSTPVSHLDKLYNASLIEKTELLRETYIALAARHPEVRVVFAYATKGDTGTIHPNVKTKSDQLVNLLQKLLPGSHPEVVFWGARELLESAQREKTYTLQLKLAESPISTGEGGYIALANLKDYWQFVTDAGALRKYIFESNVRDWQGDVEVNQEIRDTLEQKDSLNFWWLNNGITVLASRATLAGKTMSLDDVQVVNGLQTTVTIHEYLKEKVEVDDKRSVLVRIIETDDPEARDRIIKATNHQTAIPPASLKATDRIQRDMETYFKHHGWYYDRRKNYYKNLGMPVDKIIGIPYLAQAVMSILLREPDSARARPSTLIKNDADYKRVFSEHIGFEVYLFCAQLMKQVEDCLRISFPDYKTEIKRNLRYHVAMVYVAELLGTTDYKPSDVQGLVNKDTNILKLEEATKNVVELFMKFQASHDWPSDRVTKSRDFVKELCQGKF